MQHTIRMWRTLGLTIHPWPTTQRGAQHDKRAKAADGPTRLSKISPSTHLHTHAVLS